VLAGIHRALRPAGRGNGQAIIDVLDGLMESPAWRPFFGDFEFPYGFYGPEEYLPRLEAAGFDVRRLELIPKDMVQDGPAGLAGWIRTTWLPFTGRTRSSTSWLPGISSGHRWMRRGRPTWAWCGWRWRRSGWGDGAEPERARNGMILYRPVGLGELALIAESGYRAFPPRLPEQPIFYPALNFEYAAQIAREWNTGSGSCAGFVTRFEVDDTYVSRFEVQEVGRRGLHQELWVPAEELDVFNAHIVGKIIVEAAYYGEGFAGEVDPETNLPVDIPSCG